MKNIYASLLLLMLFAFLPVVMQAAGKGYLITKDNKYITGQVISVKTTELGGKLVFKNDFGDFYEIHPFLIKGFAYLQEEKKVEYESKFNGNSWLFLQVEVGGRGIRMYRNETESVMWEDNDFHYSGGTKSTEIWLEKEGEPPFRIYMMGFRKRMRTATADFAELSNKIGLKGYRYRNLKSILREYNEWFEATRLML